jgi:hypothetical protein
VGAADTEQASRTAVAPQQLNPVTAHHPSHGKTKQVDGLIDAKGGIDVAT